MGGNLFTSRISNLETISWSTYDEKQFVDTHFCFLLYIKEFISIYMGRWNSVTSFFKMLKCNPYFNKFWINKKRTDKYLSLKTRRCKVAWFTLCSVIFFFLPRAQEKMNSFQNFFFLNLLTQILTSVLQTEKCLPWVLCLKCMALIRSYDGRKTVGRCWG